MNRCAILLVVFAVGCGSDTVAPPPPPPAPDYDMDGNWHASFPAGSEVVAVMDLLDASGAVTGTARFGFDCETWSVDGQRDGDTFSLSWTCPGLSPLTYTGEVVLQEPELRDKLVGNLRESATESHALVMLRN